MRAAKKDAKYLDALTKSESEAKAARAETVVLKKRVVVLQKDFNRQTERTTLTLAKKNELLGATKAALAGEKEETKRLKKKLHLHEQRCKTHCVTLEYLPEKPFSALSENSSRARRLEQYMKCLEDLQSKMKMELTKDEALVAKLYWESVYQPVARKDSESECREPEPDKAPNEKAEEEWEKKWSVLFKLRYVADSEGSVSSAALRRIFIAAEMSNITGGKLDTLRLAMDQSIATRIKQYDIEYGEDGVTGGMWLDPNDVVREMLIAAEAAPGATYQLNLLADGRCFGDSRNTTFFALRIVFLDGHSSTATEAIWPLAILDCEEKRGAVRLLTRPMRKMLKHLQDVGCHLPEEYCRHFYGAGDEAKWETARSTNALADRIKDALVATGSLEDAENAKEQPANKEKAAPPLVQEEQPGEENGEERVECVAVRKLKEKKQRKARTCQFVSIEGVKKANPEKEPDVFVFSNSDGDDVEAQTDVPAEDCAPDIAFWNMHDSDCGDDTDFEQYDCQYETCPCSPSKLKTPAPIAPQREPVPWAKRKVTIVLWLSADMKFLLMSLGLKCATANHACIYCTCNIHQRHDWLVEARADASKRTAGDRPDHEKTCVCSAGDRTAKSINTDCEAHRGQSKTNLFPFIPREQCVIDTLHLLLRCMDRLIHVACTVILQVLGPTITNEEKQAEFLNKTLGPVFGKVMRKNRVSFSPPGGRVVIWKLNRVNGVGYRRLLNEFKFEDVIKLHGVISGGNRRMKNSTRKFVTHYQAAWDGFKDIYNAINCEKPFAMKARNMITKWFSLYVDDYLESDLPAPGSRMQCSKAFLASFLLTPYFHALLVHVPDFLKNGHNLRSFTGQNFERANNEHRLYWQNSSKVAGDEIPAIIRQHLRVLMNPIKNRRSNNDGALQCPHCSQKPYVYRKAMKNHLLENHKDQGWTAELFIGMVDASNESTVLRSLGADDLKRHITDVSFKSRKALKANSNAIDYATNHGDRRKFHKVCDDFLAAAH